MNDGVSDNGADPGFRAAGASAHAASIAAGAFAWTASLGAGAL